MLSKRALSLWAAGAGAAATLSLLLLAADEPLAPAQASATSAPSAEAGPTRGFAGGPALRADAPPVARTLEGVVVDPSGSPISGAALTVESTPLGPLASTPLAATPVESDRAGRFSLPALQGPGRYVVRAAAPAHAGRLLPARPGVHLRIVLHRGGALSGSCRDDVGRPVTGVARVLVGDWSADAPVDRDGRFRFADLPAGHAQLRVVPGAGVPALPARADALIEANATTDVVVTHARGQRLEGRVEQPDGRPAPGADLKVVNANATDVSAARADDGGRFTLVVAPGEARLIARHAQSSAGPLRVEVPLGADPEAIVVRLRPDPTPQVLVVDGSERPILGARVQLRAAELSFASRALEQVSDGEGLARFAPQPRGAYRLLVDAPGHVRYDGHLELRDATPGRVQVGLAASLVGVVRGPNGQPAPGAVVVLADVRPRVQRADRQGRFAFEAVGVGVAELNVRAPGAGASRLQVALDGAPVQVLIDLPPASAVRGRVSLAGQPVPGALVHLEGPDDARDATADAEGRFTWNDLGRGPYRIEASAPGSLPAVAETVQAGASLDLALRPARTFLGVVRGPDGALVHQALVGPADGSSPARSFPDGRFAITVAEDVDALLVRAQGHDPDGTSCSGRAGLRPERVTLPARSGRLEVRMTAGLSGGGLVVDADGQPVPGAAVRLGGAREEDLLSERAAVELLDMTEADGRFHAHGLPREGLLVTVSHPRHAPARVRLTPGQNRVVLPRGARLSGSVGGAHVGLLIEGPLVRRATSDADGRFSVEGLPAGRYTILRLDQQTRLEVDVAAGSHQTVTLN